MDSVDRTVREDSQVAAPALAAGSIATGLLASSCCILPLVLVTIGVGGSWVAQLTALSPYQPFFLGAAALTTGYGFWRAYRKPQACAPGSLCANPAAGRFTKTMLWIGAVMAASAFGVTMFDALLV
ncbi:MAG: mercuric transporter MerT family protein [Hyphomicrobiales bacterium]